MDSNVPAMTAKLSVSSWWILALIALFIWYRNEKYDRALAVFIFTLGLVQLIEYGVYSGADPFQSGQALYITLWLQCLVLAVGVYLFTQTITNDQKSTTQNIVSTIAGWNLFLFSVIFVVFLVLSFSPTINAYAVIGENEEIKWCQNNGPFLGMWGWLYLVGIFLPLVLLFAYYMWTDLQIAILILYGVLAVVYISLTSPSGCVFGNLWCYLAVGFSFLAWFLGIIPTTTLTTV